MNNSEEIESSFYEGLGRITAAMSDIEGLLRYILCETSMRDPVMGMKLTYDMYIKKIIEWLKRSLPHFHLEKERMDKFNAIVTEINTLDTYRNKLVHSSWSYDKEKNAMRGTKLEAHKKDGVHMPIEYANTDEMIVYWKRMNKVHIELFQFSDDLSATLANRNIPTFISPTT